MTPTPLPTDDIDLSAVEFWDRPSAEIDGAFLTLRREDPRRFFAEMPVEPPLTLAPDALVRARRAFERTASPGARYAGVWEEIAFASDIARLRRLPSGQTARGRLALRGRTVSSMFRPMINLLGG